MSLFPIVHGILSQAGAGGAPPGPKPWTDFSEYSLGSPPGDWSEFYGIGFNRNIVADGTAQAFDIGYDDNFSYNLWATWNPSYCPADQDYEVLAKLKSHASWNRVSLGALLAGTNASPTGFVTRVQPTLLEQGTVAGSGEIQGSISTAVSLTLTNWVWVRLRMARSENAIRVKAWQDGDSEPGSWMLNRTGTSYSNAGVAGFRTFYAGANGYRCGYFSYAIGGGAAPGP